MYGMTVRYRTTMQPDEERDGRLAMIGDGAVVFEDGPALEFWQLLHLEISSDDNT